jgi:parallel beta-helix repeat protein
MKCIHLIAAWTLALPLTVAASQTLNNDTTWTGDISIDDDVIVRPGVTLTVNRASVKFARRAALMVHGRLVARNSKFTSAQLHSSPHDWRGIEIARQPSAFLPAAQPASTIEDCTLEFATAALKVIGDGMMSPVIRKNTVRHCGWGGIVMTNVKDIAIEANNFTAICTDAKSDQGRAISLIDCSKVRVAANTFQNVSDTAIFLERCNDCVIDKNTTDDVIGGPGPGPRGEYKDWAFAVVLLDSDRNTLSNNTFTRTAYQGVLVAYGSDENIAEDNTIEWCLDAINVLGDGKNNTFRRNKVNGGWTVLYHNGPGPTVFEKCNIDNSGGGACFTVRTGSVTFRDCTWNKTNGMNAWGGVVNVERCKLTNVNGPALLLRNDCEIKLNNCEMDWTRIETDPKFKGRLERTK